MELTGDAAIVIVDDDESIHVLARSSLQGLGTVRTADCVEACRSLLRQRPECVIIDLELPDGRGEDVVDLVTELCPTATIYIMSSVQDVDRAVALMRRGASDYLSKPVQPLRLRRRVEDALVRHRLSHRATDSTLGVDVSDNPDLGRLKMGPSAATRLLVRTIVTVADSAFTVLIQGETGSGKELVARAIHKASGRRDKPFVTVNCGALPRELIEAELFGHTAGAFTGAANARSGLVREADGGTLFLDEIGELPLDLQPKLLRYLQEGEIRAVGADKVVKVDTRVLAATHRNLADAVREGTFREDLLFRLSVLPVRVAPLRERQADIPALAEYFLLQAAGRAGRAIDGFDKEALRGLISEPWPGNVRELQSRVHRAVVFAEGTQLTAADLQLGEPRADGELDWPEDLMNGAFGDCRDKVVAAFERAYVARALAEADGNVAEAARRSGLPRKSLWRIAQRVGLAADRAARKSGQLETTDTLDAVDADDPAALIAAQVDGYRARSLEAVQALTTVLEDRPSLSQWTEAKTTAHRLRGSGGSYGLPQVTAIAGDLEAAIGDLDAPRSLQLAKLLVAELGG